MARTGRPKSDNPRENGVFIRLTRDEHENLKKYASRHNLTITQVLVNGFKELQTQELPIDK